MSLTPLIGDTIGVHFDKAAARFGDRDALVVRQQNVRWSYGELKEKVDAFATGLLALGLSPGERIGIWSPNNAEWVVTQFASAKAGLILVNINPAYRLTELDYALNKVGCKALITADSFKTSDYVGMLRELAPEIDMQRAGQAAERAAAGAVDAHPHRRRRDSAAFCVSTTCSTCGGERHRAQLAELAAKLQFDDPINIQFTSGTTGTPKGATLTHHNILNNGYFIGEAHAAHRPRPRLHSGAALSLLRHGARQSRLRHPRRRHGLSLAKVSIRWRRCKRSRPSAAPRSTACRPCSSPNLSHPEFGRFDLTSLRTGIMAGSPCPIEVMRRCVERDAHARGDHRLRHDRDQPGVDADRVRRPLERRVGTVGRVHPHVEVKIVDGDGRIVPPRHAPANSAPAAIR